MGRRVGAESWRIGDRATTKIVRICHVAYISRLRAPWPIAGRFAEYDRDGNGKISRDEFRRAMEVTAR